MARRFVDISVPLEDVPTNPPHHRPKIEYQNHDNSWEAFRRYYPGAQPEDVVDGKAWAAETVTLLTHSGTHLDAPWHYHPTMNHRLKPGGEPAATIDQVPLEWCFGPGVKLDFRHVENGYVLQPADVQKELDRIGYSPNAVRLPVRNRLPSRRSRSTLFCSTPRPAFATASLTTGKRAAVSATMPPSIFSKKASASWAPMRSAGMRPSNTPQRNLQRRKTGVCSGKGTKPAARSATRTWRSCIISSSFRPSDLPLRAFR